MFQQLQQGDFQSITAIASCPACHLSEKITKLLFAEQPQQQEPQCACHSILQCCHFVKGQTCQMPLDLNSTSAAHASLVQLTLQWSMKTLY
jgi:hypothetical protein